jgi:hypothetical protein
VLYDKELDQILSSKQIERKPPLTRPSSLAKLARNPQICKNFGRARSYQNLHSTNDSRSHKNRMNAASTDLNFFNDKSEGIYEKKLRVLNQNLSNFFVLNDPRKNQSLKQHNSSTTLNYRHTLTNIT